jgi:hypothetical protein
MPSGVEHGEIELPSVAADSSMARVDACVHPNSVCARHSRQQHHCQSAQKVAGGHGRAANVGQNAPLNRRMGNEKEKKQWRSTLCDRMAWGTLQPREAQLPEVDSEPTLVEREPKLRGE